MSSQIDIGKEEIMSCNRCELVGAEDVSFLEGRIKTFIESLGLNEKQETASKDIARDVLWDWFNFITDHNMDYLIDKKKWYKENRKL